MKVNEIYKRIKSLYEIKDCEQIFLAGAEFNYCHVEPISSDLLELILAMLNRHTAKPSVDGYCPRCGALIPSKESKHCDMCGQRVFRVKEDE